MPVDLQALYPKLVHLMLDTVFVVDGNHRILFVSDACESLLGYRAKELTGTLITRYMHPDDFALTQASIERVMNGQISATATSARMAVRCTFYGLLAGMKTRKCVSALPGT